MESFGETRTRKTLKILHLIISICFARLASRKRGPKSGQTTSLTRTNFSCAHYFHLRVSVDTPLEDVVAFGCVRMWSTQIERNDRLESTH